MPTATAPGPISASATFPARLPTTTPPSSSRRTTCSVTSTAATSIAPWATSNVAGTDYGEAIRVAPTDARGWRNRGMIKLMKNDNAGGIADYNKAIEYDPSDAYSWNNRGIAKRDSGDKAGAIADFKKALAINPNLSNTRQLLRELGVR